MRSRTLLLASALALVAVLAGCTAPPEDLVCVAEDDGNHLTWSPVENATSYNVYRGEAGSEIWNATLIGSSVEPSFHDAAVEAGESYRYWVTSVGPIPDDVFEGETEATLVESENETETIPEEIESEPSEPCDVTAVPEFPTLALGALAVVGAVCCYVALSRKWS